MLLLHGGMGGWDQGVALLSNRFTLIAPSGVGYPLSVRKIGLDNDLRQFAAIEDYPLQRIARPTLVVDGRYVGKVTFDHAEFVAQGVPRACMKVGEACGYFILASEEGRKIRETVIEFLEGHSPL